MKKGERQIIAETIASTVRVLEQLRFPYYEQFEAKAMSSADFGSIPATPPISRC
jgi:hypothetical protein